MSALRCDSEADEPVFATTSLENVMVDGARPPSEFGILNLKRNSITAPPEFTEQATIDAMHNLQILPRDLVPQDPPEIDDHVLRLHLTIELERRRYG
jgi:hypothetical protein